MAMLQAGGVGTATASAFRPTPTSALIRNFRRHSWLPLYLFGASPAVCRSFVDGRPHRLQELSADTLYLPHATSLRMGPLGYQSDAQRSLAVSYNSLASYAGSLHHALTEPYAAYDAIGVRDGEAAIGSSRRRCCRSRTNSTERSGRSGASAAASGRCTR